MKTVGRGSTSSPFRRVSAFGAMARCARLWVRSQKWEDKKMHKHLPQYSRRLIPHARRLRREMTIAERRLWSKLRSNHLGVKVRRQVPFGEYILDFYCTKTKLCIELDGSQHLTGERRRKDEVRDRYLQERGIEVLRFSDIEALKNTNGVLQAIHERVQKRMQTPPVILP